MADDADTTPHDAATTPPLPASNPAGAAPTPDHVPCRHGDGPISWDEICWTHDAHGFASCWTTVGGGYPLAGNLAGRVGARLNPTIAVNPPPGKAATNAEPEGDWS